MTPLLTAQLCLLAGCCVWSWTSASRMLIPGIIPDSIDSVQIKLAFAVGSCTFELPQIILHLCQ